MRTSSAYSRPAPVPKMPPGLVELMNGLAKEVLKHNPTNIYEFCANQMEKLLEIRDGPSSKTYVTLKEKIEKAQEKIRQRAKERRDKFDREVMFSSQLQAPEEDKGNILLDQETSSTVKALVHHEVDLQNASEVEISHIEGNIAELSNNSKADELKQIQAEIISELKPEAKNEPQVIQDPNSELEESDMKSDKSLDDASIFEKIQTVLTNEPLKETELKDIVGLNDGDSSLQTISETAEDNLVNNNAAILPKITIGDGLEMRELDNISGESFTEMQTDNAHKVETEVIQKDHFESDNSAAISLTGEKTIIDSQDDAENKSCAENIASDVNLNTENKSKITPTVDNKQNEANDISGSTILPTHTNIDVTDNLNKEKKEKSGDDGNSHVDTNTVFNEDITKFEETTSKVSGDTNESSKIEIPNETIKAPIEDKQKVFLSNDLTVPGTQDLTEIEVEGSGINNDCNLNVLETDKAESASNSSENIATKTITESIVAETIENKVAIENIKPDSEKIEDSESSNPKSESNENTNEDSMSMVESDLSKTDEESTQNNPNMDLETAAVTIQKVFRSFMFKSRNSTFEDNINDENNSVDEDNDKKEEYYAAANLNKERRTLGITRMESVLQTVNEEKSLSLSTDDSSTLSSAATTIQAHVRGFLVRNRLNSSKTFSMNSLVNSHEVLEPDPEQNKNKTILNIHIVPEEGNFLSRDESLITSMDLSLDGSPPSSVNLHPMSMSCDITERRKMLKREDAVQSVSPPSNNSGKLSEDSVKEVLINENDVLVERDITDDKTSGIDDNYKELDNDVSDVVSSASTVTPTTIITISKSEDLVRSPRENTAGTLRHVRSFSKLSSDESDVITPFARSPRSPEDGLVHSGEFHDVVLPTKVSRNDTPVVRGE